MGKDGVKMCGRTDVKALGTVSQGITAGQTKWWSGLAGLGGFTTVPGST